MADQMTKHALLIGINQYPKLPPDKQLHGCVNDVELMADILKRRFGFATSNVKLMRDSEATRDNILAQMDALVADTAENDIVALVYSGHGSQIRDREGDEADGWDETIVPFDSGRDTHPCRDITDDEIYLRLLQLTRKTPFVTLLFDCCHSGTISRDAFGEGSRWVEPDNRSDKDLPPALDLSTELAHELARAVDAPSGWLPVSDRYVLLAGCSDSESSYEYRAPGSTATHGALTYFLGQALTQAPPDTTYRDIFEQIGAQVTAVRPYQHPQLEGARDRALFEARDLKPMRFVAVKARRNNVVTMAAGAAHGMVAGSQWAIYPKGTRSIKVETPRAGLVEVTTVRATTADAKIIESSDQAAIQANARAIEHAHAFGEARLLVAVQAPPALAAAANVVKAAIGNSALVRVAEPVEAEFCAYLLPPRDIATAGDPVPQLSRLAKATWAVVGRDGRLCMPVHAADETDVAFTLRENFELLARYRHGLALRNPDAESALKGKVDFTLLRLGADGQTWEPAVSDDAGGAIRYREGERIAFRITNRYDRSIYVSVLDFGLSGAVSLLHPIAGASEELLPNRTIEVGVRAGDEIELFMPDNFPFATDTVAGMTLTGGTEVYKLLAAVHPADFSSFVQDGFRSLDALLKAGAHRLEELLNLMLEGLGTRDSRRNRVPPDEEWITVERAFYFSR